MKKQFIELPLFQLCKSNYYLEIIDVPLHHENKS